MHDPVVAPRRPLWPVFVPFAIVVVLALGWTAFWFQAAATTEKTIAGWRAREALSGRIHTCAEQTIGGFPFRIEVRCREPAAEVGGIAAPVALKAKDIVVAAQAYDPTLLIGELTGPLALAEPGQPAHVTADWKLAQISVRGTPALPERVSIVVEDARVDRSVDGTTEALFRAARSELHGRIITGSARENPVIEMVLRMMAATAPGQHFAVQPSDAEITAVLRGLRNFAPKPWPERLRELQAADGRIDIMRARVQQGDIIIVGSGTLALTARGRLDGQIRITVAGLDKLVALLGIDRLVAQLAQPGRSSDRAAPGSNGATGQQTQGTSRLDRLVPGLSGALRDRGGPALAAAGISLLGQRTELEGRQAVALPLRFSDGAVHLGPLPIGQTPALF